MFEIAADSLGEDIGYTQNGVTHSLRAIFDAAAELVTFADPGISTISPIVSFDLSRLPVEPKSGDTVTIKNVVYEVVRSQEDGQGWTTLILHKS